MIIRLGDFRDPITGEVRSDSELESMVREAINREYQLQPVGSDTQQELEDRIVEVFSERYAWNWNKNTQPDEIIGDVNFHRVVSEISPLSRRKVSFQDVTGKTGTDENQPPKPGYVKAPWMTADQMMQLVDKVLPFFKEEQRQAMSQELLKRQQQNKPIWVPVSETQGLANVGVGFGVGALLVGGIVWFMRNK